MKFWSNPLGKPNPLKVLLAAQGVLVISMTLLGALQTFPQWINPFGYLSLTSDSFANHDNAVELAKYLKEGNFQEWWQSWSRFHTRIASFFYAVLGPWVGQGALAIWPMNALLLFFSWKGWAALVNKLGGNPKVGGWYWLALPTVLIHHTQLIRDPFYIAFLLWWLKGWMEVFSENHKNEKWQGFFMVLLLTPLLFWSRERFWALSQVMALSFGLIAICCFFFRQNGFRKSFLMISFLVLMINGGSMVRLATKLFNLPPILPEVADEMDMPKDGRLFFFYKVALLRENFLRSYPGGTTLAPDLHFNSDVQVLLSAPRALMTGSLAPFPFYWLTAKGKSGPFKWVTLPETLFILTIMLLYLYSWIGKPPSLTEIILLSVILCSLLALGLVVTNLGALYRMRLASWCLILALWVGRSYRREEVSSLG